MRTPTSFLIPGLIVPLILIGQAAAKSPEKPADAALRQAIVVVGRPAMGSRNMSPFELQVEYRLCAHIYNLKYEYRPEHAAAWRDVLIDEKADPYARMCAAYYLETSDPAARTFLERQVRSPDLRLRYNAVKAVEWCVRRDPKSEWGVDLLISLLDDGSIDGSGITSSPPGDFPRGDGDDVMYAPLDDICWSIGFRKEAKAVPALIKVLERQPGTGAAAFALGEIGDRSGIPILMKILESRKGDEDEAATALGKFRHKPAVPLLLKRLGNPRSTFSGSDILETEAILNALRDIRDPAAIEPIKAYLQKDVPAKSKTAARRVLVQLESADPVGEVLALLDRSSDEFERSDLMRDLCGYHDRRVSERFDQLARHSPSAFMRHQAVLGLARIGTKDTLLTLAGLLEVEFPKNFESDWGKVLPDDYSRYFPELIQEELEFTTGQRFGKNARAWRDWLEKNGSGS